jgi:hypothetical protein
MRKALVILGPAAMYCSATCTLTAQVAGDDAEALGVLNAAGKISVSGRFVLLRQRSDVSGERPHDGDAVFRRLAEEKQSIARPDLRLSQRGVRFDAARRESFGDEFQSEKLKVKNEKFILYRNRSCRIFNRSDSAGKKRND